MTINKGIFAYVANSKTAHIIYNKKRGEIKWLNVNRVWIIQMF